MTTQPDKNLSLTDDDPDEPGLDAFSDMDEGRTVKFDRWGRYLLPHPDDGKETSWTRATTLAGTLADSYNLERWKIRKVLEGLVASRGLVSQAAEVFSEYGPDPQYKEAKDRLNEIGGKAQKVAKSGAGADMGTELHALTEDISRGELLFDTEAPEHYRPHLTAYVNTLAANQITIQPEYMERIICIPDLKVVGRLDALAFEAMAGNTGALRVFDLKTQKDFDFGALEIAIQLAIYSRGYAMFNEETWAWESMPPGIDQSVATVAHLPILAGQDDKICELYDVDLDWGWRWARASYQTREARRAKPVTFRTSGTVQQPKVKGRKPRKAAAKKASPAPAAESPAVVESGPVALQPTSAFAALAKDELVNNGGGLGLDWAAIFRQAKSPEDLRKAGEACVKAGAMTDELKAIGKARREALSR